MNRALLLTSLAALVTGAAVVAAPLSSGLKPGESVTPFHPKHLAGPLAGTSKCFPCTFQNRPQVQVWVNGDDAKNVTALAGTLSKAMKTYNGTEFKGLVVFVTTPQTAAKTEAFVRTAARNPALSGVGMAVIDSRDSAIEAYNINTAKDVRNTVIAYRDWKVADSFVNLTAADTARLEKAIAGITK
ncbi:MAG: hypothetical protein SFU56_01055 [Capsulimonadales bacterium]|nr:hypothetical protein [Capsulimonadales bacterium]